MNANTKKKKKPTRKLARSGSVVALQEAWKRGYRPIQTYDDIAGLVTTVAILAALSLSIIMGLWLSFEREEFDRADMEICATRSKVFRQIIVNVLEAQGFAFTIDFGKGIAPLKLNKGTEWRCSDSYETRGLDVGTPECPMFIQSFDPKVFRSWQLTKEGAKECPIYSPNMGIFEHGESMKMCICGGTSIVLLFAALICSTITYVSLLISDAHEEEKDAATQYEATNAWVKLNRVWIGAQYLMWTLGTIFMLMFACWSTAIKFPSHTMSRFVAGYGFVMTFVPLAAVSLVLAGLSLFAGNENSKCFKSKDWVQPVAGVSMEGVRRSSGDDDVGRYDQPDSGSD